MKLINVGRAELYESSALPTSFVMFVRMTNTENQWIIPASELEQPSAWAQRSALVLVPQPEQAGWQVRRAGLHSRVSVAGAGLLGEPEPFD